MAELGFSLHAATTASADDSGGREALVRYALRPPIAQERLELLPDELVRIQLRHPFRDGTVAVDLDPLSLLCRLAASVPPPRFHTVRYAGVLGSASNWRARVVPPPAAAAAMSGPCASSMPSNRGKPPTHRSGWRPWSDLMRRCFAIDVQKCPRCSGRMTLRAPLTEAPSIQRLLRHLGEPTEPPKLSSARSPPFYESRVLRRRSPEVRPQMETFGG